MRPLGSTQRDVLAALAQHGGRWSLHCGWLWDTDSNTLRIFESLVRRGLVNKRQVITSRGGDTTEYSMSAAGRQMLGDA